MLSRSRTQLAPIALAVALVLGGGCSSTPDRLTYDNYSRVAPQTSTQTEVSMLLGEPTNRLGEQWIYERPRQHLFVFVDFDDQGRVSRKQWIDAPSGTWDDTRPQETPGTAHSKTIHRSTTHSN